MLFFFLFVIGLCIVLVYGKFVNSENVLLEGRMGCLIFGCGGVVLWFWFGVVMGWFCLVLFRFVDNCVNKLVGNSE